MAMFRVRGLFVPIRTLALLLSEIVAMALVLYLFAGPPDGRMIGSTALFGLSAQFSVLLALSTMLTMVAVGLYNYDAFRDYRATLARAALAVALEAPVIFVAMLLYKRYLSPSVPAPVVWYCKVIFLLFACVLTTRAVGLFIIGTGALKRRVVVIGTGECAARVRELGQRASAHFTPAAFVAFADHAATQGDARTLDESIGAEELMRFTRQCGASEIIIATDDRRGLPVRPLLGCKLRGIAVTDFLSFYERETGRVDLDALQPSWLIFSDGFRMSWTARAVKRVFDVMVSAAMLVLTLPLLVLTALFIKLEDGGPIFYAQERVGLFGRHFTLYKFRSMRVDAENGGGPQWAAKEDARITRLGAIIRRIRIDELPQLLNVLKGDMSFIGPRPERPYFVEQLARHIPFYDERLGVKPGITGWAQIRYPYGASLQDARQKLSYDLFYLKNHTLLLDLLILIQTVRVILFPEGAR
jgi:sugar transferase (PEP-CTERM system associated)